jgi:hypothetical protein
MMYVLVITLWLMYKLYKQGLLTGGAFPQGSAIMFKIFLAGKSRRLYKTLIP